MQDCLVRFPNTIVTTAEQIHECRGKHLSRHFLRQPVGSITTWDNGHRRFLTETRSAGFVREDVNAIVTVGLNRDRIEPPLPTLFFLSITSAQVP